MHLAIKDTKEILKSHKLRVTAFREEVLHLFNESEPTLSLRDLEQNLENYDRVTLYRTLKAFEDHGIIHKVPTDNQQVYYGMCKEACGPNEHHHSHAHFNCRACENVFCVETEAIRFGKNVIEGYQVEKTEILLEGLCPDCTDKS